MGILNLIQKAKEKLYSAFNQPKQETVQESPTKKKVKGFLSELGVGQSKIEPSPSLAGVGGYKPSEPLGQAFNFVSNIVRKSPQFVTDDTFKPKSREMTDENKAFADKFRGTLVEVARSFGREGAGAVVEVLERVNKLPSGSVLLNPGSGNVLPGNFPGVEKFIFGEKPIESLTKQGEETLKGFGVSEATSKKFGLSTGMVFLGLDLLPPGGKDVIKLLAKADKVEDVLSILKTVKGVDNTKVNEELASIIAKTTDEKEITKLVGGLTKKADTLTTKVLNRLEGKEFTSKQEILDLAKMGDVKEVEKEVIHKALDNFGDNVNVAEFRTQVDDQLLTLTSKTSVPRFESTAEGTRLRPKGEDEFRSIHESVTLPTELRGDVENYFERVFESPVKTSAGKKHMFPTENYFGHNRLEDLTDGKTRRVIEVQNDLYQKGGLESELPGAQRTNAELRRDYPNEFKGLSDAEIDTAMSAVRKEKATREAEIARLSKYNNPTAHLRQIREEIKYAAIDGKTKLQFPTGETAMKIEGLGERNRWYFTQSSEKYSSGWTIGSELLPRDLKVGMNVTDNANQYIITDVLGDGKFKAMPKEHFDSFAEAKGISNLSGDDLISYAEQHATKNFWGSKETFDISGKVNQNNPIYRFYEKEVGRYLKNKYGAEQVTDAQGVKWWEVKVDKGMAKAPVEAFGAVAGIETDEEGNIRFNPEKAAMGAFGVAGLTKGKKFFSETSKERGFIESVKQVIPKATKIAGQYIPRATDELAVMAKNLIRDDLVTAEKIALTRADDSAVAVASELIKKYGDDAIKADEATAAALYDKAADIANTLAPKLTEQGRSIQAASILGRLTPEGQLRFAAREIQRYNENVKFGKRIPELTGEQTKKILEEMKIIRDMDEGIEKAKRFQDLQTYIKNLVPTPLMKKIVTVWKAGLLTGIKTSGLNIFSNLSHTTSEIIKDVPAAIVDSVTSLLTRERTKTFTLKGESKGLKEGFEKGLTYLKTGFDERNLAQKLDYHKVNFGKGVVAKAFQGYTDTVFRVMGSADQPFYYGALSRSLMDQALAQGINKGLKGTELKQFAETLIQSPTEEMLRYGVADAATAVFQNETYLGKAARGIQNIPIVGEIVVPFGRTPSAVATQIVNYTPVGTAIEIFKQIANKTFNQRLFSEAVGRGLTGTAVLAIGYELGKKGLVSLDRPTTEREQKLWELEGRASNKILINGKWRSPIVLGPAGNLLLVGAHFNRAFEESGSPTEALSKAMLGSAKSFTEQTFLTGINQAVGAINDPARFAESYLGSMVASIVPTIVSDVARATDDKERRAENIPERLQARIPGVRKGLEPKVDVLGREIESIGNPLEILADPTRPSPDKNTPVIQELRRITDAGFDVSPTLLGDKKGFKGLSQEENTSLWKRAGEITNAKLESLFSKEQYQELSDEEKSKIVEKVIDKSKVSARAELAIQLTDGLSGQQLKTKLSELKAGGLLTQEVFKLYKELR